MKRRDLVDLTKSYPNATYSDLSYVMLGNGWMYPTRLVTRGDRSSHDWSPSGKIILIRDVTSDMVKSTPLQRKLTTTFIKKKTDIPVSKSS